MSEDDDQRLIERCFREHSPAIARYFLRRCATAGDAEEATTDVFAIAWRRIDRLPPEPETRLWLFGVARNVLADHQRAARRRARLSDRLTAAPPRPSPLDPRSQELPAAMPDDVMDRFAQADPARDAAGLRPDLLARAQARASHAAPAPRCSAPPRRCRPPRPA